MSEVTPEPNREFTANHHGEEKVGIPEAETLQGGASSDSNGGSEANALRHGLTAAKHLPQQIEHRTEEILGRLLSERQLVSELDRLHVMNAARRAATLEFIQHCEIAALTVGGRNAHKIAEATLPPQSSLDVSQDDFLTAAVSSDFLEKVNRYRRGHERSLFWSLNYLGMIAANRQRTEMRRITIEECRRQFPDADACVSYLIARNECEKWRCLRCDSQAVRHWLKNRRLWECGICGCQISVRHTTVMANSPIPIEKWFWAILLVCSHSGTTSEIAEALELNRLATAKRIRDAIEAALNAQENRELLMGLPALAARMIASPETSVSFKPILRNETVPS